MFYLLVSRGTWQALKKYYIDGEALAHMAKSRYTIGGDINKEHKAFIIKIAVISFFFIWDANTIRRYCPGGRPGSRKRKKFTE